jgi:hypothetical protein
VPPTGGVTKITTESDGIASDVLCEADGS